jgi:hypothetical protein
MMVLSVSSEYRIGSIAFEDGGAVIQFVDTGGVRKEGALQLMQTLFIAPHPDYAAGLDDLRAKAEEVLSDALEDYTTADVVDLVDDDEEDAEGMGFG